jgi:hypothetical protein
MNDQGKGFLGQLIDRAQPPSLHSTPVLSRRRPSLFEPRGGLSAMTSTASGETVEARAHSVHEPNSLPPATRPEHVIAAVSRQSERAESAAHAASMSATPAAPTPMPSIPTPITPPRPAGRPAADRLVKRPQRAPVNGEPTRRPEANGQSVPNNPFAARPGTSRRTPAARLTSRSTEPPGTNNPQGSQQKVLTAPGVERVVNERVVPALPPRAPLLARSQSPSSTVAHPSRASALASPVTPLPPVSVHVSIGRIEIRGGPGVTPTAPRRAASAPRVALDDYLRQRHGSGS